MRTREESQVEQKATAMTIKLLQHALTALLLNRAIRVELPIKIKINVSIAFPLHLSPGGTSKFVQARSLVYRSYKVS
jgi:hypothetical protein